MVHFWNPTTWTFIFDKHELVPTIEKYDITIIVESLPKLTEPPIGPKPASAIVEFLEVKKVKIEKILKK